MTTTLDNVLHDLGDFGKYQYIVLSLFSIAVIIHSAVHVAFVFSAKTLDYRCKIPECEGNVSEFEPSWLQYAVPYEDNIPVKCEKFQSLNVSEENTCSIGNFNRDILEICDNFVYKTQEITILNDFNLHCDENLWKLTLIGTINTIGQFIGLPTAGILSDRFGRRTILVLGIVICGIFGIARSFAPNYIWFAVLEFLDATFSAGTYACGFILGVELVGPNKRVLAGTIICCCYALGEVLAAAVAWLTMSWRPFILILYIPPLFLLTFLWITPESVRWLLTQERYKEVQDILKTVARMNGTQISENALEKLSIPVPEEEKQPFTDVFKSKILVLRFVNSTFCWITCAFLFYGLTLNSIALAGNSYLDFILTSLVEIPAYITTYYTLDKFGRKLTQSAAFFITAIACLTFIFISEDNTTLKLCFYLLGKYGATGAFTACYVISSELFPTPLRHSLMGVCSMFGRIGSMVSPQMPLLEIFWKPFPLVLFACMATLAGLLTLQFPETLNIKLPDTIDEAETIGKKPVKKP